jgi:5-methylcytosine-specific restriction endonuclease McrA
MRPVNKGGPNSYSPPATLTFHKTAAADVSAVLGTTSPTLEQCLRDVWLVVAKVMAKPPANFSALNKALDAIKPRVGRIYKQAAAPLLASIGDYCSYCESRLGALAEVEHAAPKAEFPLFATEWKNFLLACGPCNISKDNHPSRADLKSWRGGVDLNHNEDVSYDELRAKYVDWPDRNSQSCRLTEYYLERLDSSVGWVRVPRAQAIDLTNAIVRTDFTAGAVFADLPTVPATQAHVRVRLESPDHKITKLIELCKLNNSSASNPSFDRREMNRTIAWFEIVKALSNLQSHAANPPIFDALWTIVTMHARTLGFYSLWIKLLADHADPAASHSTLATRFINGTTGSFPGTVRSHLP